MNKNINELIDILSDYRTGELDFLIDENHIRKWISQFESSVQYVILSETVHIFRKWYFHKKDYEDFLSTMLVFLRKKYIFAEQDLVQNVSFFNQQNDGESQKRLITILNEKIRRESGASIVTNVSDGIDKYVYIDDGLYTGKRARKDLSKLVAILPQGSKLDVFYMVAGTQGLKYVEEQLRPIAENRGIVLELYRMHPLKNVRFAENWYETDGTYVESYSKEHTCLWPSISLSNDEKIKKFENHVKSLSDKFEKRLYRSGHWSNDAGIFSTEENRNIVEKAFLKKGIEIVESCKATDGMYPLGYNLWPSFGFGSFTANYMNISNTCPLVLWWGNTTLKGDTLDAWYPLLPRRVNANEIFEIDEDAASYEIQYSQVDQYNMCPDCGKCFGIQTDGGNGFCIDCAWKH